jgi:hypothetical protein
MQEALNVKVVYLITSTITHSNMHAWYSYFSSKKKYWLQIQLKNLWFFPSTKGASSWKFWLTRSFASLISSYAKNSTFGPFFRTWLHKLKFLPHKKRAKKYATATLECLLFPDINYSDLLSWMHNLKAHYAEILIYNKNYHELNYYII